MNYTKFPYPAWNTILSEMIQLITGEGCIALADFNSCLSVNNLSETFLLVEFSSELFSWEFELDCMP